MATKLEFDALWRSHPLNNAQQAPCRLPKDSAGGLKRGFPSYPNQCAIRMGVCLRGAGVTIDQLGRITTCDFHPREEMHVLNAQQTADAVGRLSLPGIKPVEKIIGPEVADFYNRLFGRRGIVFFKDYWSRSVAVNGPNGTEYVKEKTPTGDHIDVWNGYRTSAAWLMEWFSWLGYYHTYSAAREIWFWEVE
jgi:hypothetical protein